MRQPASITKFKKLYNSFTASQRRKYLQLVVLGLVNIVLDIFGLILLYAAGMSILDADFARHLPLLQSYFPAADDWTQKTTMLLIAILVALFILKGLLSYGISKLQINVSYGIAEDISAKQYTNFLFRDYATQKKGKSANYIHELYSVVNSLSDHAILSSVQCFSEISFLILALFIVAFIQFNLLILFLLTIIPAMLIFLIVNRNKLSIYGNELNKIIPRLYESVTDAVYGFTDIRLHGKEAYFHDKFSHWRSEMIRYRKKSNLLSTIAPARIMESAALLSLFIIALYAYITRQTEDMTAMLALFAALSFRALPSINRIISALNTFNAVAYIMELIPTDKREYDMLAPKVEFSFLQSLEFKKVNFGFDNNLLIVRDMNLTLPKGSMVGIKGGSGEGKTTLLNLILGFYRPNSGEVTVDGKPLEQMLKVWQQCTAYVEQDAFLLSGTLLDNIAFGEENPDLELANEVLKKAMLTDWVDSLEHGLQTYIGERGSRISAGQRQRVAIARALYSKAEVFIFDEATNALDAETKIEVLQSILNLKQLGYTLIVAAHDLTNFIDCDVVYELKNGKLYKEKI